MSAELSSDPNSSEVRFVEEDDIRGPVPPSTLVLTNPNWLFLHGLHIYS